MKSSRTLPLSVVALGLALLIGTPAARAQLQFYYAQPTFPWGTPTMHNFTFTSVSSVNDLKTLYFGVTYGFTFTGTTSNGVTLTVQVLGPGGNIIGSRIGTQEMLMMRKVVDTFRTDSHYSQLSLYNVERQYGAYSATTKTSMRILVAAPQTSTYDGTSGGLVELEVNGGDNDFYVESVIRRQGSCSNGGPKDSRLSALRKRRSFILNGPQQATLDPASLYAAELFLDSALRSVGNTVLDVSGARKLEDSAPNQDPYHVSRGRCAATYLIDDYQFISIRTLRN